MRPIVMDRGTPLAIVVIDHQRIAGVDPRTPFERRA
jgi:hypothetical protein